MRDHELGLALRELSRAEVDDDALRRADATARVRARSRRRLARLQSHVDQLARGDGRRLG